MLPKILALALWANAAWFAAHGYVIHPRAFASTCYGATVPAHVRSHHLVCHVASATR